MPSFWDQINSVIDKADILLLVLDARLPEATRNTEIEDKIAAKGKPLIYVISKCDLCDARGKLRELNPVYVSATNHLGLQMLKKRIMITAKRAKLKTAKVGVLGYPNVGKSSLINAIKGAKAARTSVLSGCTKRLQEVKAGRTLILLDTPGVLPYMEKDFLKHVIIGSISFNDVDEPEYAVYDIMKAFPGVIEAHYGVQRGPEEAATLESIALKRHMLKRGGVPDIERMAKEIMLLWQKGTIKLSIIKHKKGS
jgi:ribosome biogenesis GTPase A